MAVESLVSAWQSKPDLIQNISTWQRVSERQPRLLDFPGNLLPTLANSLHQRGIEKLYSHQVAAFQHVDAGQSVVVATATASGKSLCYHLPVFQHLWMDSSARALFLFPTKALAQDQFTKLQSFFQPPASFAAVYDGDTPTHQRPGIRKNARLVISNPDMLHTGILPHHTAWVEFLANLQFVVLDEMHTYRGVFGSHVANVIRRLKRIVGHYRRMYGIERPLQFILTSATISNPQELAAHLTGEEVALIDEDGSSRGEQHFLMYNPPVINPELGLRRSSLQESVYLAEDFLNHGIQTLIFARSRQSVEILLTYLRERFPGEAESRIRGYRSGYLPGQRREIEQGLRFGQVRAVVATNALELGVDIGAMGAVIMVGYPGTVASTWQQAGRAGRGSGQSVAVMIATADPLDQFLVSHPEYLFGRSPENGLINPDNLVILLNHIRCAAFELSFSRSDWFGDIPPEVLVNFLDFLVDQGVLHLSAPQADQRPQNYYWMADEYPAQGLSLRSSSADRIVLQAHEGGRPRVIGEVDGESAHWMAHPGAIYLHEAKSYCVDELDLENHLARLSPCQVDYYTEPRQDTTVALLELRQAAPVRGGVKAYGEISVTRQLTGFRKIRWFTHEVLGLTEITLPPTELQTVGYWLALSEDTVEVLRQQGLWRNDPNDYGPNWGAQKKAARQRDQYRCRNCGVPEEGRSHDVHHISPFRTFPSFVEANQLPNLITLCPSCHHRAESVVRIRSGLGGLAFVLAHLAPLFLMCDRSDLGIHADPQSPLADGRPAVILYDQTPQGIGLSERLFEIHEELVLSSIELVSACACADGCPSCTGPGGEAGVGGKAETLAILKALVHRDGE